MIVEELMFLGGKHLGAEVTSRKFRDLTEPWDRLEGARIVCPVRIRPAAMPDVIDGLLVESVGRYFAVYLDKPSACFRALAVRFGDEEVSR